MTEVPVLVLGDTDELKTIARLFKAANHPARQKILQFIHVNGPTTVKPIYQKQKLTQSQTSLHLSLLRKAGLVRGQRQGSVVLYTVNYERMADLQALVKLLSSPITFQNMDASNLEK